MLLPVTDGSGKSLINSFKKTAYLFPLPSRYKPRNLVSSWQEKPLAVYFCSNTLQLSEMLPPRWRKRHLACPFQFEKILSNVEISTQYHPCTPNTCNLSCIGYDVWTANSASKRGDGSSPALMPAWELLMPAWQGWVLERVNLRPASSMDFLSFDGRPVYVTALFAFDRHRVRTRAAGISMPVANLEACARPWQRWVRYGAPADC